MPEELFYSLIWRDKNTGEIHWLALGDGRGVDLAMELDYVEEQDYYDPTIFHGTTEWTYAWMPSNGGKEG